MLQRELGYEDVKLAALDYKYDIEHHEWCSMFYNELP